MKLVYLPLKLLLKLLCPDCMSSLTRAINDRATITPCNHCLDHMEKAVTTVPRLR